MTLPRLLLLTDRAQLPEGVSLRTHLTACVDAGATHIVVRELDLSPSARAALVEEVTGLGATVLAARERVIGVDGLHQSSTARGRVHGLTGRSCHTRAEADIAAADGCAYITLGPFAATDSKPGYGPALDPATYADLPLPTYALGGVGQANAASAVEAGASGVAVMGAVMRSRTPGTVVRDLLRSIA